MPRLDGAKQIEGEHPGGATMNDPKKVLEELYGFRFPDSFFEFLEFAELVGTQKLWRVLGVGLDTPFLVASGEFDPNNFENPLWEGRAYDDPPEFFGILYGNMDGQRWGYYVEEPDARDFLIVSYYHSDTFEFSIDTGNVFKAVREILEFSHRDYTYFLETDTQHADHYHQLLDDIAAVRRQLMRCYTMDRPELGDDYLDVYDSAPTWYKPVAQTWMRPGISIPAELYEPLSAGENFQFFGFPPDEVTLASALEETLGLLKAGSPGAALKLGRELWAFRDHHETSYSLLDAAYESLGRDLHRRMLQVTKGWREACDRKREERNQKKS